MKISQRAQSIDPFFAMEFGKRAAALESEGHQVIKLSLGEPDFGPPPAVLEAARKAVDGPLPYTGALGTAALREAIAAFYLHEHGVAIAPSRIIVTAGASAALLLVTAALVDTGDEVIVGDPSYPCNRQFLSSFGAQVKLVSTDASSRFQLDANSVRAKWTTATKGLMIATPSNPTGTSVPPDELRAICDWAREHGAWRLVDEIYLNLGDRDAEGRPPQTVLAFDDGAIVINSFSKYFGMTGWRLGWAVVPEELVPTMERLAQNYYICASNLSQQAALACFTPESLAVCEARRVEFGRRRELVLAGLAGIGLPVPVPPDGAFYVYFDVSATGLTSWQFCERALDEVHVALTPGKDFGHCGADQYVRLSYAASADNLNEAIRRLGVLMARLAG
ncbi:MULTISPECIES: pyridoxal phosphate-dependent aminotransferase [unclassified Massilia]|uniref:pyridoxal phosphate-dependent aminotransferase n=1 Tax=unclassified Massilia TaxID=2609279 RepID=UPI0017843BA4|nr:MULTISPECIES: pyridoxal phosphate-dependent aminotransferase [unclassified Massilia]MBD8529148.1 pyridoxal phosphate-dependent aminotransferase [Massilia sp. CFBP 13647]MBD8672542.1 pyridoxal phosphate-dependent aminotransferase [Massilia sp. CFBP 13721]